MLTDYAFWPGPLVRTLLLTTTGGFLGSLSFSLRGALLALAPSSNVISASGLKTFFSGSVRTGNPCQHLAEALVRDLGLHRLVQDLGYPGKCGDHQGQG